MTTTKRRKIIRYLRLPGHTFVTEVLECEHLGKRGTIMNVSIRIAAGKARLCFECSEESK